MEVVAKHLWLLIGLVACGSCVSNIAEQHDYQIHQNALMTPPSGPRVVGEVLEPDRWSIEGGYERRFAQTGLSREAGGNGHALAQDELRARLTHMTSIGLEVSGDLELGLPVGLVAGSAGLPLQQVDGRLAVWADGTMRKVVLGDTHLGLILQFELGLGSIPYLRDIVDRQLQHDSSTDGPPQKTTTTTQPRDRALEWRSGLGASGVVDLMPWLNAQLGGYAGFTPTFFGYQHSVVNCQSAGTCSGQTADDIPTGTTAGYLSVFAALTAHVGDIQTVLHAAWLAASNARLEDEGRWTIGLGMRVAWGSSSAASIP